MAHVRITQGETPQTLRLVVDGVDMTDHVYTDGFGLVQVGDGDFAEWGVRMVVAAETLDVDLPNAVIEAVRKAVDK